jgi:serine/threonine-protein kinase RsbW
MLDARGEGERAVCLSAMVKNSFMRHLHPGVSPFSIVERVNRELLAHVGADFHLQAFLGVLDLHSGELSYCNAGGAAPVVYRAAGRTTEVLATHGAGIAVAPDGITGESRTCIGSGDCLVLFSRGMYRLFNLPLEKEKNEMAAFVAEVLSGAPVEELPARLTEKYHREKNRGGLPIDDDISLLFAAMLTTSVKTQLRESLGFNVDDVVYLQFLNYLEEMDRVTAVILSAMDFAGYPDELIRKMKIVLTELLVNAVIHGNGKESMKRVVIGHLIDRDRTVISIMDEGDGFDPSVIPDPTLPENIDKPCGRGLFIVRHYVETIRFNRTGNRVTIIKKNQR